MLQEKSSLCCTFCFEKSFFWADSLLACSHFDKVENNGEVSRLRKAAKIVCVALCEYQLMVVGWGVMVELNLFFMRDSGRIEVFCAHHSLLVSLQKPATPSSAQYIMSNISPILFAYSEHRATTLTLTRNQIHSNAHPPQNHPLSPSFIS
jgi:hypothetical protein